MSADQLKQTLVSALLKLLNSAWSMIVVFLGLIWLWLGLDDAQVQRVQELEPILNSKVGGFFIILVIISYVVSIFGSLKDEIRLIFTLPMQGMTKELCALIQKTQDVHQAVLQLVEQGERQQRTIQKTLSNGSQAQESGRTPFL